MKKTNVLREKSYRFARRAVKLSRYVITELKENVLAKQVLRPGTSIGANVEEAFQGESKLDLIHKLSIANKEAFKTNDWIRI